MLVGLHDFSEEQERERQDAEQIDWEGQPGGKFRNAAKGFVTSHAWNEVVVTFVLAYVLLLVMRADGLTDEQKDLLATGEEIILGAFLVEIFLRLLGLGLVLFVKSQQNILDLLIFICTVIGTTAAAHTVTHPELQEDTLYHFCRLLRVLQVVRIMYKVESVSVTRCPVAIPTALH